MYTVDDMLCTGCAACQAVCPHGAITLVHQCARIDAALRTVCGACVEVCPSGAIFLVEQAVPLAPQAASAPTSVVVHQQPDRLPSTTGDAWRSQVGALLGSGILWAGRQLALGALAEINKRAAPGQTITREPSAGQVTAAAGGQGGRRHRRGRRRT